MLNKFRQELDEVLDQEELLWYQKSRIEFIKDGDRNTKFFHVSTLLRRWKNKIAALKNEEGIWVRETNEVKGLIVQYYKKLFTEENPTDFEDNIDQFPETDFQVLHPSDFATLAKPFTEPEIAAALWSMSEMKAPGPDGFQALFYKKNWELVADSFIPMVTDVLEGRDMPLGLNDTNIVVIPKVQNPEFITQFRPIGLCNVSYKTISKVLANHLRKVLPPFF